MSLQKTIPVTLVLFGFSILGLVTGIFVGRSGLAPAVVASLIPAILTLGGGFIIFKSEDQHPVMGPVSVILFSIALLWGGSIGYTDQKNDLKREADEATELIESHFRDCSIREEKINRFRTKLLDLPPLKSAVFCGSGSKRYQE